MSIDEIEEKFTMSQLFIFVTIQGYEAEKYRKKRGKVINTGQTPEEINKNAWKYL